MSEMRKLNSKTVDHIVDFTSTESCRHFLNNLHIDGVRVKGINLDNGSYVTMEDIPEDQVVQRALEIRNSITGKDVAR